MAKKDDADAAVNLAEDALATAKDNLATAKEGPTAEDIASAQTAITSAQQGLQTANDKLAELTAGPTDEAVQQAQDKVATAASSLSAAQAKRDEVYAGSTSADIQAQQSQVQLAELSLTQAKKALEGAQIIAPFDGTVALLNINVGDTAGSSSSSTTSAPIILNTPNAVVLNLSIGESDLPNVKAGQSGTASFDAITGTVFPIVIDSVGTNPTTTQGVVTYQARARIVTGQARGTGRRRVHRTLQESFRRADASGARDSKRYAECRANRRRSRAAGSGHERHCDNHHRPKPERAHCSNRRHPALRGRQRRHYPE